MSGSADRLAYMADQIARNFVALGHDRAAAATADHIAAFWDPRMRTMFLDLDEAALSPLAARAAALLRERGSPPPQTRATVFAPVEGGEASDAG